MCGLKETYSFDIGFFLFVSCTVFPKRLDEDGEVFHVCSPVSVWVFGVHVNRTFNTRSFRARRVDGGHGRVAVLVARSTYTCIYDSMGEKSFWSSHI